jgi:predicted nucleic acid-binding protein
MHLLYRYGGYAAQQTLWSYLADDMVTLHIGTETECARMRVLMETYSDAPMDFADASIVAAAESLGVRRVFTLDRHFYFYRIEDAAFEVVPARR